MRHVSFSWQYAELRTNALVGETLLGTDRGHLSKAGWSWGCVAVIDREGRTIWIVDAHRGDGQRFVVHADEKLSAFLELEKSRPGIIALPKCRIMRHDSR